MANAGFRSSTQPTELDAWVPRLTVEKIPGATHWIVHEQPLQVAARISAFVGGTLSPVNRAAAPPPAAS